MHALVLGLLVTGVTPDSELIQPSEDWQGLDAEIQNLASSLSEGDSVKVGAVLRSRFTNTGDLQSFDSSASSDDMSGFDIQNARLRFSGDVGRYSFYMETELATNPNDLWMSSTASSTALTRLLWAGYVDAPLVGTAKARVGYFHAPVLSSSLYQPEDTLMINRSLLGQEYDFSDPGAMLYGGVGPLGWFLSLQNGVDGTNEDYSITGRLTYDFGESVFPGVNFANNEGALGYEATGFDASLGFVYQNDGGLSNGDFVGGEGGLVSGPFSLHGEVISYNEQYDSSIVDPITGQPVANTSPVSITGGWLIGDTGYEAAVRWETVDDVLKTNRWTLGVNLYLAGLGHLNKFQFNLIRQLSDDAALEGSLLLLGWTVGI